MPVKSEVKVSFTWVTGDCVYGDPGNIRASLEDIEKGYVMAVSGKTYIWRGVWQIQVSEIINELPDDSWQRLSTLLHNSVDPTF